MFFLIASEMNVGSPGVLAWGRGRGEGAGHRNSKASQGVAKRTRCLSSGSQPTHAGLPLAPGDLSE